MFKSIWNNREWIFSGAGWILIAFIADAFIPRFSSNQKILIIGIGLLLIVCVYLFFPSLRKKTKSIEAVNVDKQANGVPIITPSYIYKTLDKTPLLQRENISNSFVGITIKSNGMLLGAKAIDGNNIELMIPVNDNGYNCVLFCTADSRKYRGLDLLKENHPIEVEGKIKNIDLNWIYLSDDVKLKYSLSE